MITLGESPLLAVFLEKVIQLEWFGTLTNFSPSLFFKQDSKQIKDQEDSWINMMLKKHWVLRLVLMIKLFLRTLCVNILIYFKIMLEHHSQLNELIASCCYKACYTFWSIILCWNNVSLIFVFTVQTLERKYKNMVLPIWFLT